MDYEDLNLRPTSNEEMPIILSVPVENSHNWLKIAGAVVLVIAVGATGYLVFRNRQTAAPAATPAAAAQPATDVAGALGADIAPIALPPLNDSDDVVRGLVKELSSNPSVLAWLMTRFCTRGPSATRTLDTPVRITA